MKVFPFQFSFQIYIFEYLSLNFSCCVINFLIKLLVKSFQTLRYMHHANFKLHQYYRVVLPRDLKLTNCVTQFQKRIIMHTREADNKQTDVPLFIELHIHLEKCLQIVRSRKIQQGLLLVGFQICVGPQVSKIFDIITAIMTLKYFSSEPCWKRDCLGTYMSSLCSKFIY